MAMKLFCSFVIVSMMLNVSPSLATPYGKYRVGNDRGWRTFNTDISTWTDGKEFHVGDSLLFVYNGALTNVVQTSLGGYGSCDLSADNILFQDASGETTFTFTQPGEYYFTSSMFNDCSSNLRLIANVK
ncbi:basic blue protein-like [Lycium barbarum]|uniref:basic blue protein-like n=1 Tax=Lycium barbarum TaxID=112863 RepID=UPI00293F5A72|nr:basic blue protein-like [Lycium barbarum]